MAQRHELTKQRQERAIELAEELGLVYIPLTSRTAMLVRLGGSITLRTDYTTDAGVHVMGLGDIVYKGRSGGVYDWLAENGAAFQPSEAK